MSDPGKAVFLSYASQDVDAAKRIAEALRASGVEVWFDQSELVGGDAWDQKIRGQVKACALFVPVISAATQARTEGYFRLEWRLADQRTHLMAKGRPFLLPVVIDDTRDADAHVPDSFTEVQWTRLPGGETSAAFANRVNKLLGGSEMEAGSPRPAQCDEGAASPIKNNSKPVWLWVTLAIIALGAAYFIFKPRRSPDEIARIPADAQSVAANATKAPAAPLSEARKLTGQAQALIDDPNFTRENYQLADELCRRALALDASDAEVWAVAALVSEDLITETYDYSAQRRELARTQSERAVRLDPQSIRAGLSAAKNLRLTGDLAEAVRRLRELLQRAPADRLVLRELARTERRIGNDAGVSEILTRLQALPGGDPRAMITEAKDLRNRGRLPEAEVLDDQLLTGTPVRLAYYEKLFLLARGWLDLEAATAFLPKIPADLLHEDAFGSMIAQIWLWQGEGDKALAVLNNVPHDFLEEFAAYGPKGYLVGWGHRLAGRSTAAQAEWRNALELVEARLAVDKNNLELLAIKATLQVLLGQKETARATWRLRVELGGRSNPVDIPSEVGFRVLLGETDEAVSILQRRWAGTPAVARGWYVSNLRFGPEFAPIRNDPRVQRILAEQIETLVALRHPATAGQSAAGKVDEKSVAVLAFANLSDDKNNEYFSDGISEELLNVLAKVPGLKVSARTSAFYFKGKQVPMAEIAQQLGVAYVVEGSVRKQGDKVRITAQLIKAADGFHVWSDTFTRDLKDIFAVQDEIAGLIAKNLELKMGMVAARPTIDLEAYQEYLTGRAMVAKAGNGDLLEAVGHFAKAVAIEPKFTAAWVQLASAHTQLGRWGGAPTLQSWAAARAAIDHAFALEPDSPDVLLALGWVRRTADWDWRGAEQAFRRALQLRPNHPETLAGAAVLLYNIGKDEEAFRLGQEAAQLDPLNPSTQLDLSIMFYLSNNPVESERTARRALSLAPGGAGYHSILGWALMGQRRYDEAVAEAALDTDEVQQASVLGPIAVARGQIEAAHAQVARLEKIARTNGDSADLQNIIAWISAGLGEKDRAFAALEKACASRDPSISWLRNGPYLAPLFSDPRWDALLRKVGLADDQLK